MYSTSVHCVNQNRTREQTNIKGNRTGVKDKIHKTRYHKNMTEQYTQQYRTQTRIGKQGENNRRTEQEKWT
jgi:transcription initiation factor TFIID subunit TAF12